LKSCILGQKAGLLTSGRSPQEKAAGKEDEIRLLFILKESKFSIIILARYYSIGSDKTFLYKADEMTESWTQ
jgi:formyltetrahydrofolate hydrolase